jgi:hypothetical protein
MKANCMETENMETKLTAPIICGFLIRDTTRFLVGLLMMKTLTVMIKYKIQMLLFSSFLTNNLP